MSEQNTPVIVAAVRTPVGRYLGGLSSFSAPHLGSIVIREALRRAGVDGAAVDEVIMGQVLQGGSGQAPARQAMIHAGIPGLVPALTINKVCGSGLKAVMLASQAIKAGDAQCVVAGGQEAMSASPHGDALSQQFLVGHGRLVSLVRLGFNTTSSDEAAASPAAHR